MILQPVILSGGAGTRLWPLSRELYPKQLLPLLGDSSLLQDTVLRMDGLERHCTVHNPLVVCNEEHRFMVAEQLRQVNRPASSILLEPIGRNTAPALTVAALAAAAENPEQILLALPADHAVNDLDTFQASICAGLELAEQGGLVTFGIVPTRAETGYGYIRKGEHVDELGFRLDTFVEKPDLETAQHYLDSNEYLWNSGMFMMRASRWLEAITRYQPGMLAAASQAYENGQHDLDFYRLDKGAFSASPADSIDYAVMEPLSQDTDANLQSWVIALDAGWSDVGAWSALWDIQDKDSNGNVCQGDVFTQDTRNSLVMAGDRLVATLGIEDSIIVDTTDAVAVVHKDYAQDIKNVVSWLKQQQREEHILHRRVYRPWGHYESMDMGDRFQVKRITVSPGASLSLQLHHKRAEHWVVVKGTAHVHSDGKDFDLQENQSTYIPAGTQHRLANQTDEPVEIIEIQTGSYLGEDDIVRFDDHYGR